MDEKRRVTLADLARKLGLTKMSVARALKGGRGVSEATRAKVRALAEKMGYAPDPAISIAMARMRAKKPVEREVVAWLAAHGAIGAWRSNFMIAQVHRGAERQAERLGYRLEEFCLNEPGMSPRRVGGILYNRGIRGIVLAPLREHGVIEGFPWQHFAAVCCGQSLIRPRLHRVLADQAEVVQVAWRTLLERGHRRIGLCVSANDNNRVSNLWLSAHLGCQQAVAAADRVPPMVTDDWRPEVFLQWYREHRPDAVLSFPEVREWMRRAGLEPRGESGFALLNFDEGTELPGVDHRFEHLGAAAVSLVAAEIGANQFGVPEVRKSLSMECAWRDPATGQGGASVRRAP